MNENQRRSILELLVKSRLGKMVMAAVALGMILVLLAKFQGRKSSDDSGLNRTRVGRENAAPKKDDFEESLPVASQYKALVSSYGERVGQAEKELERTRKEIETLRSALTAREEERRKEKDRSEELLRGLREAMANPPGPQGLRQGAAGGNASTATGQDIRVLELSPSGPAPKKSSRKVHIPLATGGQATLMNGTFAPVTGEPSPVRLRFDAALLGPNKSRLPMRDAYLIGKAAGDANSVRVSIQIDKLAYVKESGEAVESKVLGYVVSEDGLEGVPGSYEWRATELLPLAGLAGGLSYGADALAQGETTTSITPLGGATNVVTGNPLKFAGFRSAGGASGKMEEIIAERMREIRPAVSVPANRKLTVVFLEGVTLEGLKVEEIDDERDFDPFRGLDLHR